MTDAFDSEKIRKEDVLRDFTRQQEKYSYRDRLRDERQERLEKLERESKRTNKAALLLMLLILAFSFLSSHKTFAANSGSVIESAKITIKQNYGDPEEMVEPTITSSTSSSSVSSITYSKDSSKWKPGQQVTVTITLEPDSGYYFAGNINRSKVSITGGVFHHAGVDSYGNLDIKAYFTPNTVLGNTTSAGWDSTGEKAVWRGVTNAPGYEVVLYADDKKVTSKKVTATSVDFSENMKDGSKNYYYEVKAIPMTADQKKYLKEGEFVTSVDDVVSGNVVAKGVTPVQTPVTPSGNQSAATQAAPATGAAAPAASPASAAAAGNASGWKLVNGVWYYYDISVKPATGWRVINGLWYYFNASGQMQTGWVANADGTWSYLDPVNGHLKTGWILYNGSWYYIGANGKMVTGWFYENGKMYYFDASGRMTQGA